MRRRDRRDRRDEAVSQEMGWLLDLTPVYLGAALIADAPIGATVLYVNDAVDFEETGGTLYLGDEQIGYDSVDLDADTITLNGPLTFDADVDDMVAVWDVENAQPAAEIRALVEFLNAEADDDPISATLTHSLGAMLPMGPRDGRGETVLLEQYGPSWRVVDVFGKEFVLSLAGADPDSIGVKPKAPTGLELTTSVYTEAGVTRARLTAAWDTVTQDTDDHDLDDGVLVHYELQLQRGNGTLTSWIAGATTDADDTDVTLQPFEVGVLYAARVRAVTAAGVVSDWSTIDTVTTAADADPPNRPSTPTATTRFGVHYVTWDGRDDAGDPMPPDFAFAELHKMSSSGATPTPGDPTTMVDQYVRAGTVVVKGDYSTTVWFRLIAVDTSGNASVASAAVSSTPAPLVDVSNFPDDAMEELYARTAHFITLDADQVTTNNAAIGFLETGVVEGAIVAATQFQTYTYNPSNPNAAPSGGGIRIRDLDGFKAWSNTGTNTVTIDRTTGVLSAQGAQFPGGNVTAGTFTTGASGTAHLEAGTSDAGANGIAFYRSGGGRHGRIVSAIGSGLRFQSADGTGSSWTGAYMELLTDRAFFSEDVQVQGDLLVPNGGASVYGPGSFSSGLSVGGGMTVSGGGTWNGGPTINGNPTLSSPTLNNPNLAGTINTSLGGTGGSSFVMVGNGGVLSRGAPSSLRYKEDVEELDLEIARRLLGVDPITWHYRDREFHGDRRYSGFGAEQMHDHGLDLWVEYDETGRPDQVRIWELIAPLLALAQDHERRLGRIERAV